MQKDRRAVSLADAFTFTMGRSALILWPVMLALGASGCASAVRPARMAVATEGPAGPSGPAIGTVDAVRPIGAAQVSAPQDQILMAMGVAAPAAAGGESEIVVQRDDGQTLSVVQPDATRLVPGERVMIIPGAVLRVLPIGTAAPARVTAQLQWRGGSAIGGAI